MNLHNNRLALFVICLDQDSSRGLRDSYYNFKLSDNLNSKGALCKRKRPEHRWGGPDQDSVTL